MIFGLFCGLLLLCVCVIGCGNGPSSEAGMQAGRYLTEVLPSTASHSLLYRPSEGCDPTITLPQLERERSLLTGLESASMPFLPCDPPCLPLPWNVWSSSGKAGWGQTAVVIVKQSCLLGGTLSFSLGHRVWGIRADNGVDVIKQCQVVAERKQYLWSGVEMGRWGSDEVDCRKQDSRWKQEKKIC